MNMNTANNTTDNTTVNTSATPSISSIKKEILNRISEEAGVGKWIYRFEHWTYHSRVQLTKEQALKKILPRFNY